MYPNSARDSNTIVLEHARQQAQAAKEKGHAAGVKAARGTGRVVASAERMGLAASSSVLVPSAEPSTQAATTRTRPARAMVVSLSKLLV